MDFMELASQRYSVRSYSDRSVEQEKIDLILRASQLAPTAVNYQPPRPSISHQPSSPTVVLRACCF